MPEFNKDQVSEMVKDQALDAKEKLKRARSRKSKRHAKYVDDFFSSCYFHLTGKEVQDAEAK